MKVPTDLLGKFKKNVFLPRWLSKKSIHVYMQEYWFELRPLKQVEIGREIFSEKKPPAVPVINHRLIVLMSINEILKS